MKNKDIVDLSFLCLFIYTKILANQENLNLDKNIKPYCVLCTPLELHLK